MNDLLPWFLIIFTEATEICGAQFFFRKIKSISEDVFQNWFSCLVFKFSLKLLLWENSVVIITYALIEDRQKLHCAMVLTESLKYLAFISSDYWTDPCCSLVNDQYIWLLIFQIEDFGSSWVAMRLGLSCPARLYEICIHGLTANQDLSAFRDILSLQMNIKMNVQNHHKN